MQSINTSAVACAQRSAHPLWLAASFTLLIGAMAPAAADVYKWADGQGHVHYSDLPPPGDAKLLSVEPGAGTRHVERAAPPAAAPAPASPTPAPLPPSTPQERARLKQSVDTDVASTRATQCKAAQEHYQSYVSSRRIFREGANKERVYLSDAEADAERINARREVEELCAEAPR